MPDSIKDEAKPENACSIRFIEYKECLKMVMHFYEKIQECVPPRKMKGCPSLADI